MSDFGAIILISKVSGSILESDKNLIVNSLDTIINSGNYSSFIKQGNYSQLIEWDGGYASMITEYEEEEEIEDIREVAAEEDLEEASQIAKQLQLKLGSKFSVKASFEEW